MTPSAGLIKCQQRQDTVHRQSSMERREIGHGVPLRVGRRSLAGHVFPLSAAVLCSHHGWKGCVHLVPLMGAISGHGSKHGGYKIKHECIKVMPAACLLPVFLSAQKKERDGKQTLKVAIFFFISNLLCSFPTSVTFNISLPEVFITFRSHYQPGVVSSPTDRWLSFNSR